MLMAGFADIVSTAIRSLIKNASSADASVKKTRLVQVTWVDACYMDDMVGAGDLIPMTGVAVGHLVEDTPEYVTVALEWFNDDTYRRALCVPRPLIREYREIQF